MSKNELPLQILQTLTARAKENLQLLYNEPAKVLIHW